MLSLYQVRSTTLRLPPLTLVARFTHRRIAPVIRTPDQIHAILAVIVAAARVIDD
ncbi:hypothetical protein [Buttiauxella gaviniae]|uniref:hypothetical protein n=1 Tax=Buttiauxella gaviniae TaxID=82990 RepID=UPI003C74A713